MNHFAIGTFAALSVLVTSWSAIAAPNLLTYQGRIMKSNSVPLEYNNVSFQFEITSPDGLCVLYREQVDGINMTNSGGVFDVSIGSGTKSFPTSPTFKLLDSFANAGAMPCYGGASYTPSLEDVRKLRVQFHDGTGWKVISPDSEIRSVPFAGHALSASKLGSHTFSEFVLKTGIPTCTPGTFLSWDGSALTCESVSGSSGGTVTSVSSGNAYLTVINPSSNPTLTVNVGTTMNTVAAGDDSRFSDSRIPTGSAGGDLSGTYPNPKVSKIQGVAVSATAPAIGEFFKFNGAQWVSSGISTSDVGGLTASLSNYLTQSYFNSAVASANCTVSQSMYWNSATGNFLCQSINVGVAGDVSGSLGAVSVDKIKGVAVDFSTAPTNGQILRFNGTSWVPGADNNSGGTITSLTGDVTASGTGAVASTVALVGGSTAANVHTAELAANAATDLNTASTIVKRDASGNFIAARANLSSLVLRDSGANTATLVAPTTISANYILKLPTAQGGSNQLMVNDGAGNLSWTSLSSMGVTSVGVSSPITNTGSASAPVIAIQQANGTQGGYLSSADWTAFNSKQSKTLNSGQIWVGDATNAAAPVTAAGDVTISNAGATLVGKIQGTGVVSTTPTATNNFLKYNGANWAPGFIGVADIRSTASGNGQFFPTTCTAAQTLNWQSVSDSYVCATIAISDSQITYASKTAKTFLAAPTAGGVPTFRTIASTDLPTTGVDGAYINGGNSFGAAATIGLNDNYKLSLKTNNATRMTIDNAGKVAISANAPSAQLHVVGTASAQTDYAIGAFEDASANGLGIGVDTTNGWAWLYGRSAGVSPRPVAIFAHNSNQIPDLLVSGIGVGINTTSPQAPLHVVATSSGGIVVQESANDNRGGEINFYKSRGTTASPTAVLAGDRLMGLYSSGAMGAGTWAVNTGGIQISAAENFTSTANGTQIDFGTTALGTTSRLTRMTIDPAGNVGIGTSTPPNKFTVISPIVGGSVSVASSQIYSRGSDNGYGLAIGNLNSPAGAYLQTMLNEVPSILPLYLNPSGGNVGIGTTTPGMQIIAGRTYLTIKGSSDAGVLELASGAADADGATVGMQQATDGNSTAADKKVSGIKSVLSGSTANNRGGAIVFMTKPDSGAGILDRVRIEQNGNVGIGTSSPGYTLHVVGSAGLSSGTAWTMASDARLKDIRGDYEYGLNEILKLHTVRFNYKKGNALNIPSDRALTGFIAQEVQKIIPDAVHVRDDGYLELNADPIHWATVNAVKDLYGVCKISQSQLNSIESRLNSHDRQIASLQEENRKLKEVVEQQGKALETIKAKLGL